MIIDFSINYSTLFGQNLYICGSLPELGGDDMEKALPMDYINNSTWHKSIRLTSFEDRVFSYKYFVRNSDGHIVTEAGVGRKVALNSLTKHLRIDDRWHGRDAESIFLTSPFSQIFFSERHKEATQTRRYNKEVIIRTIIPVVEKNEHIMLCGEHPLSGAWNPANSIEMSPVLDSGWEVHLPQDKIGNRLLFKFIKTNSDTDSVIWEDGRDRVLEIPALQEGETYIAELSEGAFAHRKPRFFGTAIPVFSLRTEKSGGTGEFTDLKPFGDWIKRTGQHIIQILPINDTTATGTWSDSYPYSVISVMALNPIYLNIEAIGTITDARTKAEYETERDRLNSLQSLDYEAVFHLKQKFAEIQFESYAEDSFSEPEYYTFYKNNRAWLLPYCAFCCLRTKYGTADFSKWGKEAKYSSKLVESFTKPRTAMYKAIKKELFIQYHLHKQLSDSVAYLHSIGVALKGDIPIGISPHSVEAWTESQYFNLDCQAGAPPDGFSEEGQNWGFPTYNWGKIAADGYMWWKKRLRKMEEYFDAYRIDHILGFFRIWEIPAVQVKGSMGHFSPALPMSCDELLQFGFNFNYKRDTVPHIKSTQLHELFGEKADEVIRIYLNRIGDDNFCLKTEFDTQKKIEWHFEKHKDENGIKDKLMDIVSDVLFLEDEHIKGAYHPHIAAHSTYSYKDLNCAEKKSFDAVYEHFFFHRHNELWKDSAYRKLPDILSSTNMLACAEDLGMIPACVPEVMNALHILSLEIFRMPKTYGIQLQEPKNYPYLSVSTTGTHDMETLRAWWEKVHGQPCEPQTCKRIIEAHTSSGHSMLTILPFQDWLSIDGILRLPDPDKERINIPSVRTHHWKYRMHLNIEQLLAESSFNENIKKLTSL